MLSFVEQHISGETLGVVGVAYWDEVGTSISTVFDKTVGGALFGGMGIAMTGSTHRLGLLAVTDAHLYVIETGTLVGENIEGPSSMLPRLPQGVVKSFPLEELAVSEQRGRITPISGKFDMTNNAPASYPAATRLTIGGALSMKATFPAYPYGEDNNLKAAEIARAIRERVPAG